MTQSCTLIMESKSPSGSVSLVNNEVNKKFLGRSSSELLVSSFATGASLKVQSARQVVVGRFGSSHSSWLLTMLSPQTSCVQAASQPSPLVVLPSSQLSTLVCTKVSPQEA